ncbi:hypothetical protein [Micromonospora sp. b486]|uniref:hypothetical protein n=1 Tax=Micromonospora sp. b486 TaxID=3053986 RepID=UPI00259C8589|nr:hypothetical protein [Micromonospora sp. b486]MDM4784387.1 hypothetical protein [Micromonospora sp. b486]
MPAAQLRQDLRTVAVQRPAQPQFGRRGDEHRQRQLGAYRRAGGAHPLDDQHQTGRHRHHPVQEAPAHPAVPAVAARPAGPQRAEHLLLQPGPERELVVPAVEQVVGVHERRADAARPRREGVREARREPALARAAGSVDGDQPGTPNRAGPASTRRANPAYVSITATFTRPTLTFPRPLETATRADRFAERRRGALGIIGGAP